MHTVWTPLLFGVYAKLALYMQGYSDTVGNLLKDTSLFLMIGVLVLYCFVLNIIVYAF